MSIFVSNQIVFGVNTEEAAGQRNDGLFMVNPQFATVICFFFMVESSRLYACFMVHDRCVPQPIFYGAAILYSILCSPLKTLLICSSMRKYSQLVKRLTISSGRVFQNMLV
ncbi:hypothetical protein Droror1_Dr00004033 [Drosera rotundifolia]